MSDMLMAGLELMLLGMGMVFVFLVMLIGVMLGMSRLAARFAPDMPAPPQPAPRAVSGGGASDPRLIAAITAAVSRYRAMRNA